MVSKDSLYLGELGTIVHRDQRLLLSIGAKIM